MLLTSAILLVTGLAVVLSIYGRDMLVTLHAALSHFGEAIIEIKRVLRSFDHHDDDDHR